MNPIVHEASNSPLVSRPIAADTSHNIIPLILEKRSYLQESKSTEGEESHARLDGIGGTGVLQARLDHTQTT
jgi:hypothetical protein